MTTTTRRYVRPVSEYETYRVLLTFKHPAWDERGGIAVDVSARSKRDAITRARREFDRAGHLVGLSVQEYSLRTIPTEDAP